MAKKESIKGIINCIEYLTQQNWGSNIIADRIKEFSEGGYNEIHFDEMGDLSFMRVNGFKTCYELDGFRIWAYSEKEALEYLKQIKF